MYLFIRGAAMGLTEPIWNRMFYLVQYIRELFNTDFDILDD